VPGTRLGSSLGPCAGSKICGNEAFTAKGVSDAMNTMYTLAPQDTVSRGLDQSFHWASNYHMSSFQPLIDRFKLRANVGRNRLDVNDWSFPFPTLFDSGLISFRFEGYYWVDYCNETAAATSIHKVSPESVEEWHRWRRLTEFRFARWREIFAEVKLNVRLATQAWQLLIKTLSRPAFANDLSRKAHIWMLLHGAHPPRKDAGISRPAFAQLWEGTLRISLTIP
jgi:hypothetical protein